MNTLTKRSIAFTLVLVLCVSLLPAISITADAASSYIYNWGTRGEVATSLSDEAIAFYADNNTSYDILSSYSGGTGKSDAPNSALYRELQNLMKSNHSYINGYSANNNLLQYTDCQNGGGKISSFYSGKEIGPSWDSASTWNKEHTWPNSKGLGGSDEDDVMMIRPTAVSENSSRGNTAYGKSSGYYNPNKESNGAYDLRGDVARIFLYVYVRWGNTSYAWGSSGVMESLDVLLEWMEADPVDTWELGRNDSVESITGTRNVFVDYPELGFILFGADVPENMTTPSGEGDGDCGHNNFNSGVVVVATCTDKGYTLYTCQTAGCGYSYKSNVTAEKGHSYTSGTCVTCGATEPVEPAKPNYVTQFEVGVAYKLGFYSTAKGETYYFAGTMSTSNQYYGASDTAYTNGVDVYVENATGGYYLYFVNSSGQKQYINLVQSGTHYNFTYSSTATSVFTWDAQKYSFKTTVGSEVCYIGNYGTYVNYGTLLQSKSQDTDYYARLYTFDEQGGNSGGGGSTVTPCEHNYVPVVTAPTCTKEGFTTYTCALCTDSYTGNTVAATGHSYTNDKCTVCGATKSASSEATISFASTDNRTVFTTSQQVWEQNGITVTNDKSASTSNVADYSNPARFYAASSLTIKASGNITTIVFDCNSGSYASALVASIGNAATASADKVTVQLDGTSDTFTIAKFTAQVRVDSITVTCGSGATEPPVCQHNNTTTANAVAATCTSTGLTVGMSCSDCGEVIVAQVVIPALGHSAGEAIEENRVAPDCTNAGSYDSVIYCVLCNIKISSESNTVPALGHREVVDAASAPTCTENGITEGAHCSKCNEVIVAQQVVPALGHTDTKPQDYVCDACGANICTTHNEVTIAAVAATCTATGLTEGKKCSVCGEITVKQDVIPVIPHSYTDGKCECGAEDPNYVPPTDVTPDEKDETNTDEPTEKDDTDENKVEKKDHSQCKTEVSGWKNFWTKFFNFFRSLFGGTKKCSCGEDYE